MWRGRCWLAGGIGLLGGWGIAETEGYGREGGPDRNVGLEDVRFAEREDAASRVRRSWIGPGRGTRGVSLELWGGMGGVRDVEGTVREKIAGQGFTGALHLNLSDLGIEEGSDAHFFQAKLMNGWVTFLLSGYQGTVSGEGTAEADVRLNVEGMEFGGRVLEYLLIPGGGMYSLDLENTWIGLGMQFTPFTLNPGGRIRFTPWLHLGLHYVELLYRVDAGTTTRVQFDPQTQRTFAVRGRARREEQALMPELGFGGEIRMQLRERAGKWVELVGNATYKRLDVQEGIGGVSFNDASFHELDFTYDALEMHLYVQVPVNRRIDFLCGIYAEQVTLESRFGGSRRVEGLDREVTLAYTLYGFRAGLKF